MVVKIHLQSLSHDGTFGECPPQAGQQEQPRADKHRGWAQSCFLHIEYYLPCQTKNLLLCAFFKIDIYSDASNIDSIDL